MGYQVWIRFPSTDPNLIRKIEQELSGFSVQYHCFESSTKYFNHKNEMTSKTFYKNFIFYFFGTQKNELVTKIKKCRDEIVNAFNKRKDVCFIAVIEVYTKKT